MRSFILAALGLGVILGLAILATTWHSWLSWDFAISIHRPEPGKAMVLGALVVAVALIWRWAGSRRDA
ncbi:MAG: hypothetical protein ACJ8GN_30970 [Longimicrobiaceae bacterium]